MTFHRSHLCDVVFEKLLIHRQNASGSGLLQRAGTRFFQKPVETLVNSEGNPGWNFLQKGQQARHAFKPLIAYFFQIAMAEHDDSVALAVDFCRPAHQRLGKPCGRYGLTADYSVRNELIEESHRGTVANCVELLIANNRIEQSNASKKRNTRKCHA